MSTLPVSSDNIPSRFPAREHAPPCLRIRPARRTGTTDTFTRAHRAT
ncbi:hypothetical protein M2275_007775 [Rhodococcus opacus]|nr:hypothetical protein [Rhodococcus opacus]